MLVKRARVAQKTFLPKYALLKDVPLPPPGAHDFVAPPNWLSNLLLEVKEEMKVQDGDDRRTMPVALTRCSRGGKTRSLKELGRVLRDEGIPVLFITFSDYSTMSEGSDEQGDPLHALLIRIAFVAMNEPPFEHSAFSTFRESYAVSKADVHDWLGNSPCVLLLDEVNRLAALECADELKEKKLLLHKLNHLAAPTPDDRKMQLFLFEEVNRLKALKKLAGQFWDFLRDEFLAPEGRMLVFSSHVITTMSKVEDCFDASKSGRKVIPYPLPLIPNWEATQLLFPSSDHLLTPEETLYCGLIPALLVSHSLPSLPEFPRNPIDVRSLLRTFLTGGYVGIIDEFLLPFFDVSVEVVIRPGTKQQRMFCKKVVWILQFMNNILHELALQYSQAWRNEELKQAMCTLYRPLDHFASAKTLSGETFEMLFAFTFLLRAFVGELFPPFFEGLDFAGPCSISLNHVRRGGNLEACKERQDLHAIVACPASSVSFPHVAYYLPPYPSFETYDGFAYIYENADKLVRILGFQLKRGRAYPTSAAEPDLAGASFIIRGGSDRETPAGWRPFSREETADFFGVSGKQWIPANLDALLPERHEHRTRRECCHKRIGDSCCAKAQ